MKDLKSNVILVLTDNHKIYTYFKEIIEELDLSNYTWSFYHSPGSERIFNDEPEVRRLSIKDNIDTIIKNYSLVFSAHSKQFFPSTLVRSITCINIHPGFNPYNRGWFPQVFSIINKLPVGATIHLIDEELDHGPIIDQELVETFAWDTSLSIYERVLEVEKRILKNNIRDILSGNIRKLAPSSEGNLNLKKDYNDLCRLDLDEVTTVEKVLDKLRALTHGNYKNCYFIDKKTKNKVFVKIELSKEEIK